MEDETSEAVVAMLMEIFESQCLAESWLSTPNSYLANLTPMEFIRKGKTRDILNFVESLENKYIVQ